MFGEIVANITQDIARLDSSHLMPFEVAVVQSTIILNLQEVSKISQEIKIR